MEAATTSMTSAAQGERAGARLTPWLGLGFAVLFVVAIFMENTPDADSSDAKWTAYFASSSHRTTVIIGAFLFVAAALCLAIFLSTLWSRVSLPGPDGARNPAALVVSALGATAIAIGGVQTGTIAGAMVFGSLKEPSAAILRFADQIGYPIITLAGMISVAVAIAILTVQGRRVGVFGQGMTVYGAIAAVATVFSFLFFPMLLTLIWFVAASIVLARRGPARAAA